MSEGLPWRKTPRRPTGARPKPPRRWSRCAIPTGRAVRSAGAATAPTPPVSCACRPRPWPNYSRTGLSSRKRKDRSESEGRETRANPGQAPNIARRRALAVFRSAVGRPEMQRRDEQPPEHDGEAPEADHHPVDLGFETLFGLAQLGMDGGNIGLQLGADGGNIGLQFGMDGGDVGLQLGAKGGDVGLQPGMDR